MADLLAGLTGGLDIGALTGGLDLNVGGLDLGSLVSGLTGGSAAPESQCDKNALDYDDCKKKEDEAAAKAALEAKKKKEEQEAAEANREIPVSSTGLACSMDGMVDMALKLVENLLLIVSLVKELFAYAFPDELSQSVELLWKGMIGSSSWLGYAMAALYFVGEDYGFANEVCEAFGYGFYVIDGMNYIVAFASPSEDSSAESSEASEEDK